MTALKCGTITVASGSVSGTVDGWPIPFNFADCPSTGIFWSNVDQYGFTIQFKSSGGSTRYAAEIVQFNYAAKTGYARFKCPQLTNGSAFVAELWLDTTQTEYVPTYTSLSLTNDATTNSTTGWTNDLGGVGSRTTSPSPFSGTGYLTGGNVAETRAHQDIDVSSYSTNIDAGLYLYEQKWWQAGFASSDNDRGEMEVDFLDNGGSSIVGRVGAGDLLNSTQTWRQRQQIRYVPPNTRTVRVYVHMVRATGVNNDAYINLIQPSLISVDPYGPVKVYQNVEGTDMESVSLQSIKGTLDSTGKQGGVVAQDPNCYTNTATSGDTNSGRGVCYDQTTYWYGTDNGTAAMRKYSGLGSSPTVVATNSNVLTDSGVASANAIGAPEYYGGQVLATVNSASACWMTFWDTSLVFQSKWDASGHVTDGIAVCVIPANSTGGWGSSARLFIASPTNNTQLYEFTTSGTWVGTFQLSNSITTIVGLTFSPETGTLWLCGQSAAEFFTCDRFGNVSRGVVGTAPQVPGSGGVFGGAVTGNRMGMGHGPNNTLYTTIDNGATETVQTWVPRTVDKTFGGGMSLPDGDGDGIYYNGLAHYTTFALFASGSVTNTTGKDECLVSYWDESAGTTNTRVSILRRNSTGHMALWDTTNGYLDTNPSLTPTTDVVYTFCGVYVSTTERRVYYNGGNKNTQSSITAAPSALDTLFAAGDDASLNDGWYGSCGYFMLWPDDPTDHMVKVHHDSLLAGFYTYAEVGVTGDSSQTVLVSGTATATNIITGTSSKLVEIGIAGGGAGTVETHGSSNQVVLIGGTATMATEIHGVSVQPIVITPISGAFGEILAESVQALRITATSIGGIGSHPGPLPYHAVFFDNALHVTVANTQYSVKWVDNALHVTPGGISTVSGSFIPAPPAPGSGGVVPPVTGGSDVGVIPDPTPVGAEPPFTTPTDPPPVVTPPPPPPEEEEGSWDTALKKDDWSGYTTINDFLASNAVFSSAEFVNGDLYSFDVVNTFNGHKTLKLSLPELLRNAPENTMNLSSPLTESWQWAAIRWTPGFTTEGDGIGAAGYKIFGWGWQGYDGRGTLDLTNTDQYQVSWDVRDQSTGEPLGPFTDSALQGYENALVTTEWMDGNWWNYVVHVELVDATHVRQSFYLWKVGDPLPTGPIAINTAIAINGDAPPINRFHFGINYNQVRLAGQNLSLNIGAVAVWDATVVPNPFNLNI